ncbi:hypothetical protein AAT17_10095 [Nonlabens sp. MIC269]|uniref:L-threonylcarbamoyladenylate synthase n=1 Tax=Nonlabens TaxID=363408 RepID=UPI000721DB36|nr:MULTISPECIES: Sua5/YciO/YrdC/YwlC family protein [unclassified Nonlabens]ALM21557.1 hypothetical protein AAT17_10095 [Nonlabens sp. MIC269]MEE2801869.1 Sua5/YciO/YrdC/YwlC family protein [Bacteroidota bacterium]
MKKKKPDNRPRVPKETIDKTVDHLKKGHTLILPMDGYYYLCCDAQDIEAVEKTLGLVTSDEAIFYEVLVDKDHVLERYVEQVPDPAWNIIDTSKRPVTLVLDKPKNIAPALILEDNSTPFKITYDRFTALVTSKLRSPLLIASSNFLKGNMPEKLEDISQSLIDQVDSIISIEDTTEKIEVHPLEKEAQKGSNKQRQRHQPTSIIKISNNGTFKIIRK